MNSKRQKFLPDNHVNSHDLCFLNHDILVQLLASGENQGVFVHRFKLNSHDEIEELNNSQDIFEWLENHGRTDDRIQIIRTAIFPALLSDFLHFIYEALDISKKAKLAVTYALLRKPLQEDLCLFEQMLVDMNGLHNTLSTEPEKLYSQSAGGCEAHAKRIEMVLKILEMEDLFDSKYIAQLRYDKNADDGFDGLCNKATHLFTAHKAIKTEKLNVNFIFSDSESRDYQWNYLYSRLPYLLVYARSVIERLGTLICQTNPLYLEELERRSSAGVLIWSQLLNPEFINDQLINFIQATENRLKKHLIESGISPSAIIDLVKMNETGDFPGESYYKRRKRHKLYEKICSANLEST